MPKTKIPCRIQWSRYAFGVERLSDRGTWELIDSDPDRGNAEHDARVLHEAYGFAYRAVEQSTGRVLATFGAAERR